MEPVVSQSKLRTLLVDDSSATRRALATALESAADVEIVGSAATARSALTRIEQLSPDVVVSKCELPEAGVTLLRSIRDAGLFTPVVFFDAGLEPGSPRALDAMFAGAAACVSRPSDPAALQTAVAEKLLPALRKLRRAAVPPVVPRESPHIAVESPFSRQPSKDRNQERPAVVAIATSTGGPDALAVVLGGLPVDFAVPVVIVQHMPSGFTNTLAERLSTLTRRRVREAFDGARLDEAEIWIAPGGQHLLIVGRSPTYLLRLSQAPPENSCRPSADVLFRSVAAVFGPRSLGVVLTGMGQDGLAGCQALRAVGSRVIAQDQATSVVWSMPRAVAEAELADAILPLSDIAFEIARRCRK